MPHSTALKTIAHFLMFMASLITCRREPNKQMRLPFLIFLPSLVPLLFSLSLSLLTPLNAGLLPLFLPLTSLLSSQALLSTRLLAKALNNFLRLLSILTFTVHSPLLPFQAPRCLFLDYGHNQTSATLPVTTFLSKFLALLADDISIQNL